MKILKILALAMALMLLCGSAMAGYMTGTAINETKSGCSHEWELVSTITEATCAKAGKGKYKCTKCGKTKTAAITRLAHELGEWTVTKESTCTKRGSLYMVCARCGKKLTFTIPKAEHTVAEWKIIREATATRAGKRSGKCSVCGKKVTETYYIDDVVYIHSDAALIRQVQEELRLLGYYSGEITGLYSKDLISAVKKFQRKYKLTVDGVAWPDTLALLGINQAPGTPIKEKNLSAYKLQLGVVQVSEAKESYAPGETILFQWTVESKAKKDAKTPALYLYTTIRPDKDTDTLLDESELLEKRGVLTGTYEYTVQEGETRIGFVLRAKIGSKTYTSNTVQFKFGVEDSAETESVPATQTDLSSEQI